MELNVWTSTKLVESSWSDKDRKWTVVLERDTGSVKEKRGSTRLMVSFD